MNYTELSQIIPPWGEHAITMVKYLFSTIATMHFGAMIPRHMRVRSMARYFNPIAKYTYKLASWLAIVYGVMLCMKVVLIGMYMLLTILVS